MYAADPVRTAYVVHARPRQLSPDVSGSSGPHCVEQVDFWGEFLTGGDGSRLRPCRCRNPPPTGHESNHGHGPCRRDSIPPVLSPGTCYAAWRRGAVSYLTPEVDAFRSGGDFPVWTNFPVWTPPTPNRTGTTGTRCVHSARLPKMTRRVVQKTENAPPGRPQNQYDPSGSPKKPKMPRRVVRKTKHAPSGSP